MTTIMCGEIIEWIIKIACFCSSSNSRIPIRNHYSKQIDPNFEKLRALAGKDQYCEKIHLLRTQITHTTLSHGFGSVGC